MKKLVMFIGLACIAVGLLFAQAFNPVQYEEITLSAFNRWQNENTGGDVRKFKISLLYNSKEDITLRFIGSSLEGNLNFETESLWPAMQSGQKTTVYFTAQGPWVWDRQLDAIDYGNNRLVQADSIGSLAQGTVPPVGGGSSTGSSRTPATNPTVEEIASSQEKPAVESSGGAYNYGYAPTTTVQPERVIVQISGKAPQRGRYYRLQIGSFSVRGNATRASNKLRELGLSPAFEEYQNKVRVVLARIPGEDVVAVAQKIGSAGFSEIWCREEP
jgi:hypothetical protein